MPKDGSKSTASTVDDSGKEVDHERLAYGARVAQSLPAPSSNYETPHGRERLAH